MTFNDDNTTYNFNEQHKAYIDDYINNKKYLINKPPEQFEPFSLDELNAAINKLNSKISLDENQICNRMFKKITIKFQKSNIIIF